MLAVERGLRAYVDRRSHRLRIGNRSRVSRPKRARRISLTANLPCRHIRGRLVQDDNGVRSRRKMRGTLRHLRKPLQRING